MNIEQIEKQIEFLQKVKKEWEMPPKDLNDKIVRLYIQTESVTKTAKAINEEGHRIGNRKYTTNDITDVIMQAEGPLSILARSIYSRNWKAISIKYN